MTEPRRDVREGTAPETLKQMSPAPMTAAIAVVLVVPVIVKNLHKPKIIKALLKIY
jgi:hypothetical protein